MHSITFSTVYYWIISVFQKQREKEAKTKVLLKEKCPHPLMSRLCFVRFFLHINFSSESDFILVLLSAFKRVEMSGPINKHNRVISKE